MDLFEFVNSISEFHSWGPSERIRFFGWYLHIKRDISDFTGQDLLKCFDDSHVNRPPGFHTLLKQLVEKKPSDLIKSSKGYRLENRIRAIYDKKFPTRPRTALIENALRDLPNKVPNLNERTFLNEAVNCITADAPRAAIVMTWNLVFHHLANFIYAEPGRLRSFNDAWKKHHPGDHKKSAQEICRAEDFSDLMKESKVIEIAKFARIISADVYKILDQSLDTRNSAAHPSSIVIQQSKAETYVEDLILNVVLKLN